MIIISYNYDNEEVLAYRYADDAEGQQLVIPRQDEYVEIEGSNYRVETVHHHVEIVETIRIKPIATLDQRITIYLTRQLPIRNFRI